MEVFAVIAGLGEGSQRKVAGAAPTGNPASARFHSPGLLQRITCDRVGVPIFRLNPLERASGSGHKCQLDAESHRGSHRIASALEGENTVSAASVQGHHAYPVCPEGLSRTVCNAGPRKQNSHTGLRGTSGG